MNTYGMQSSNNVDKADKGNNMWLIRSLGMAVLVLTLMIVSFSCDTVDSDPSLSPVEPGAVYTLTAEPSPAEGGTVEPSSGEYDAGTEVEITANPFDSWRFDRWEGDLNGADSKASLTFDSDKQVTAVFVKREYPLTINIEGQGRVDEEVVETLAATDYEEGTEVRLTASADEGWTFVEWGGDLSGNENPISIVIDEEKEVTAVFEEIVRFDVVTLTNGDGKVLIDPDQESFEDGDQVTFTAEADEGWTFDGWQGDLSGDENPQTVVVDKEMEVTAVFTQLEFTLNLTADGLGQILATPDQPHYYHGDEVVLQAEPDQDWRFVEWSGDLSGIESSKTITIGGDELTSHITAHFVEIVHPLWAMGYNHNGQLGDGTTTSSNVPVQGIRGFFDVDVIAAGGWHSLIVNQDGTLLGTGINEYGQLGDGTSIQRVDPVVITDGVTAASANEFHSMIIKNGALWATGRNHYGQLGDGSTNTRFEFSEIRSNVKAVAAGDNHSLFITDAGELWGMGSNRHGQLGFERDIPDSNEVIPNRDPIKIDHDHTVIQVATGLGHTLFIDDLNDLYGIGNNNSGQLGLGGETSFTTEPVLIAQNVEKVAAGRDHSLYIQNGRLYGMGHNAKGQIGVGSDSTFILEPEEVDTNVKLISAGLHFSVYVKDDGTLWGMGENEPGQLGDGSATNQHSPVLIDDGEVIRISAGIRHTLFVKQHDD